MNDKKEIKTNIGAEKITFENKTREEIREIARKNNEKRLAELKEKW